MYSLVPGIAVVLADFMKVTFLISGYFRTFVDVNI